MKYIIELEDEPYMREDGVNYYTCKSARWYKLGETIINRLTPYTDPDRKAIEDEVWEFVRCVHKMNGDDYHECFDIADVSDEDYCTKYSYQEAKAKYEAWLKQEEEIHVGDEVETELGNKACVLYENPDGTQMFVFKADGTAAWWSKCAIHKTGKNHPEVAELLEKMRGEE